MAIALSGSLLLTGSLTTTGTITAQTLNVQQVTSSIVYSSGSNIFGNSLSNTQIITGSVSVTGSLSVNGVSSVGSVIGTTNYIPKFTGTNALGNSTVYESGNFVGVGNRVTTNSSVGLVRNFNVLGTDAVLRVARFTDSYATLSPSVELINYSDDGVYRRFYWDYFVNGDDNFAIRQRLTGGGLTTSGTVVDQVRLMLFNGGNVGIGTSTNEGYKLDVNGSFRTGNNGMALDSSGFAIPPNSNTPWNAFRYSHPQNIIPNGDLESWTSGTSTSPDGFIGYDLGNSTIITRESTTIKQGLYSAKISNPLGVAFSGMTYDGIRIDKTPSNSDLSSYTISFWYIAPTSNGSVSYIGIYDNAADTYALIQQLPKTNTWTFYSKTFSIRNDSNWQLNWWVSWGGGTVNDVLYVDSIVLNKGSQIYDITQSSVSRTGNVTRWGTFTNNGAATFSSSVTTASPLTIKATNPYMQWQDAGGTRLGYIQHATNLAIHADTGNITFTTPVLNLMTIISGGNVGIGTTTPNDKFHVVGGIYSTSLTTPTNTQIGALQIGYDGTNGIIRTWNSSPLIYSVFGHHQFDTNGSERMRITSGGAVHHKTVGVGGYSSFIGTVAPNNTGDRYCHVKISTASGMMFWVKVMGWQYTVGLIEGMAGGYIYGSTGPLYNGYYSGSIPVAYFNATNSYAEIVIDTLSGSTSNRWGSFTLIGGSDNLGPIVPLEIIAYSWTSTTTQVY